jgi:hypothetical protein
MPAEQTRPLPQALPSGEFSPVELHHGTPSTHTILPTLQMPAEQGVPSWQSLTTVGLPQPDIANKPMMKIARKDIEASTGRVTEQAECHDKPHSRRGER